MNNEVSNKTLAAIAAINISAAGARAAVNYFLAHIVPILSGIAVVIQVAIGAITLYHLLKNKKKDANEKNPPNP
jgi:Na+/H+ antiporter NhaB